MSIALRGIGKQFGEFAAVKNIDLDVPTGALIALLGPSGCGKTTLLRIVAGFLAPDDGDVRIGGKSMRGVAPNRRPVNMVFQHLALFPMMTVGENVGYGLARRSTARNEIAAVEQHAALFGRLEPGQDAQQRGLAAARRTQNRKEAAALDRE